MRRRLLASRIPDLLYGSVVAGSMLAVASIHAPSSEYVAVAVAVVAVVFWLAHVYVEAVGGRFEDHEHAIHVRLVPAARDNIELLLGAAPPLVIFLLCRLLGSDVPTAAWIALWCTTALLAAAGGLAGYLAGARGWALAGETALAGGMGLLVIGLKYLLH